MKPESEHRELSTWRDANMERLDTCYILGNCIWVFLSSPITSNEMVLYRHLSNSGTSANSTSQLESIWAGDLLALGN